MVDALGPDDSGSPNFQVREYEGTEVFKYNKEDHPTILNSSKLIPITAEGGIVEGDQILVAALTGGFHLMTVGKDEGGALFGKHEKLIAFLAFSKDDRKAWVCTGLANTQGLEKLEITT